MIFADPRWLCGLLAACRCSRCSSGWRSARAPSARSQRLVGTRPDHVLLAQRRPSSRVLGALLRSARCSRCCWAPRGPSGGASWCGAAPPAPTSCCVIDVSASMDARDVPPSRLDEARREALAVLDRAEREPRRRWSRSPATRCGCAR